MAGPVADRLALMTATEANLEPIYLVYDGGGAASDLVVANVAGRRSSRPTTPDGTTHRLWSVTDPRRHEAVDRPRRRGRSSRTVTTATPPIASVSVAHGAGTGSVGSRTRAARRLLEYGPQVHAIHRVLSGVPFTEALESDRAARHDREVAEPASRSGRASTTPGLRGGPQRRRPERIFRSGGSRRHDRAVERRGASGDGRAGRHDPASGVSPRVWDVVDRRTTCDYAHDVAEAVDKRRRSAARRYFCAPHPCRSDGRCASWRPDAPQVDIVHPQARVGVGHDAIR